jgi:hypothetical protein
MAASTEVAIFRAQEGLAPSQMVPKACECINERFSHDLFGHH